MSVDIITSGYKSRHPPFSGTCNASSTTNSKTPKWTPKTTRSHQVSIPSPPTSSTYARTPKSTTPSSTPPPSPPKKTSGSSGTPATKTCTPKRRTIRAYHRRFSPHNWTIRVLDRLPSSPLNVAAYLDTTDPATFPRAFIDGTIGGDYAPQHTSDLVRLPLLLKYGGAYADVGMLQIGDLDRMWCETVGDAGSRFEVFSYDFGGVGKPGLTNYCLMSGRNNRLFARCHRLLLALWDADGGKVSTEGMHDSPLLRGVPLMGGDVTFDEEGRKIEEEEVNRMLTDYIIQGQVISMVMGLVDEEDGWDGPKYVAEHVYAIDWMVGSQLINQITEWDGKKAFELMSLSLPKEGEMESAQQTQAREIVEACLQRSFGFKLAHGLILRVLGDTLRTLWREHEGSDDVVGTYARWLRWGTVYCNQDGVPPPLAFEVIEPFKRGPLLREN